MFIDISLEITPKMVKDAEGNEKKALVGHMGTHFDVMNKKFPLEYLERKGIVFDVSNKQGDIQISDIDIEQIEKEMFVAFYTGFQQIAEYGCKEYFKDHPQLSNQLIDRLLSKEVSIIGIDCAGIRRGKEHTPIDQYCANRNTFVVENLCNLEEVLRNQRQSGCIINTYPVKYSEMTGLPCRVVVKLQ